MLLGARTAARAVARFSRSAPLHSAAASAVTGSSAATAQQQRRAGPQQQQQRRLLLRSTSTMILRRSSSFSPSSRGPLLSSRRQQPYYHSQYPLRAFASSSMKSQQQQQSSSSAAAAADTSSSDSSASTSMKDEYGTMNTDGHTYTVDDFVLENGHTLPQAQLRYQTYGQLNDTRDNVMVVCHALTGNASLHVWWGDLLGPQLAFDTSQYFVVCCNILGSCYGSTGPTSINPRTQTVYGMDFPDVSVQDSVRLQLKLLKEELKIQSVQAVIGGSFGGMQVLEYGVQAGVVNGEVTSGNDDNGEPFVQSIIPIACGAHHTAWQIAISEVQRQAIRKDANFAKNPFDALQGLAIARQIGMVSYRTHTGYQSKFGRARQETTTNSTNTNNDDNDHDPKQVLYGSDVNWTVKSYLDYQGTKFQTRFDPVTYMKLTEQMDSHDVSRGRASSLQDVLASVEIPALVLGIDSDVLYPLSEQQELAKLLPNATLKIIQSEDGHDGFLLEQEQVGNYIIDFLEKHKK